MPSAFPTRDVSCDVPDTIYHIRSFLIERPSSRYKLLRDILNVELHQLLKVRTTMVNFAELKAKAEKVKDASITKATNTRDRLSSAPTSRINWDPNWKRAPPPPPPPAPVAGPGWTRIPTGGPPPPPSRSQPGVVVSGTDTAPPVPRASRPADDSPAPPPYISPPPPTRVTSGHPPGHRETSQDGVERIDWANLSSEDKEEFFGWLDEFFSRYLGIELSARERRPAPSSSVSVTLPAHGRPPPPVNNATRPRV